MTAARALTLFLILVGLLIRISPLSDLTDRLFWQFMTEDGYLMQTIARNMAIGLGMSTADGTIATNGVQPLATLLFAALFALVDGSRSGGIALITVFSALVSAGAAYCLYRMLPAALGDTERRPGFATIVAALWFASPIIVSISMNGLETGVYHLALLATMAFYLHAVQRSIAPFDWSQRIALGVLLGMTFLARNDAVFFIGALLATHWLMGDRLQQGGLRSRFIDCVVAGVTSILVALPWLIYNYRLFGSIIPISGTAQSHTAVFAQNLPVLPATMFESMFLYAPIPRSLEQHIGVIVICCLAVVAVLAIFWRFAARVDRAARRFFVISLSFAVALSLYYGMFFGAAWFLPRYLSALSPFLFTMAAFAAVFVLRSVLTAESRASAAAVGVAFVLTAVAVGASWRTWHRGGTVHEHRHVVAWVSAHVADSVWVGAPQSGTLGFFHDRTINLDGKVNPQALSILIGQGSIQDYVVDSKVQYIVDWVGMAGWDDDLSQSRFSKAFEVIVRDVPGNLAVLRRIAPATKAEAAP